MPEIHEAGVLQPGGFRILRSRRHTMGDPLPLKRKPQTGKELPGKDKTEPGSGNPPSPSQPESPGVPRRREGLQKDRTVSQPSKMRSMPEPAHPPPREKSPERPKKTKSGSGTSRSGRAVVSVDEIKDLSGLVLPRVATFQIDELKILERTTPYTVSPPRDLSKEAASVWKTGMPATGLEDVSGTAEDAGKKGILSSFSLSKIIHRQIRDYDPATDGPLADLTILPTPGIEEIELYPVNDPYAYIRIFYDHSAHEYHYVVIEPELTQAEISLFHEIKEGIYERVDINTRDLSREEAEKNLRTFMDDIISDYGISLSIIQREKIFYHIRKEFLGDGLIDPVMHDRYIEDISCDGVNSIIFVYHSRYESIKTSLKYTNAEDLDSFVTRLAQRAGKHISISEPLLDATMSDGSRIQMTLGKEVTAHGSTFTIRKFRDEPITPTDLIEWGTFSPLSVAFLWIAVESQKSCIFAGGTASGKTTSLNAISLFIPPLAKVITLEDTRELKLPHPNWIPSVTRDSFDTEGRGEIDMYELLRAALRQRPEYLLVGEVRGREAQTLFQAMSTGHVTYSTIHADSVASVVHRVENPPLDVPRNMLSALDLVCVQAQTRVGGQRIRRNKQIIEILDIDPRTNELITNEVFKWRPVTDEITYSGKSFILEEIMEERGWDEERMMEELRRRQEVLEWMRVKNIRNYRDVSNILISYFRDPESVIRKIRSELNE